MPANRLGEMIDYFRKKNNWTLDELGERLNGKSTSAVSRWISGDRYPTFDDLDTMVSIFNTDIRTLMYGFDEAKSNVYRYYDAHWVRFPRNMNQLLREPVTTIELPNILMSDEYIGKPLLFMRVFNDSLNKVIPKDSLIGILECPVESLKENDIVVFNENDNFSMKYYIPDSGASLIFRPASFDTSYTDFVVSVDNASFEIIGKVVVYIVNTI